MFLPPAAARPVALAALLLASSCSPTVEPEPAEPITLAPAPFQRLTEPQIRNTYADLLGLRPTGALQPDEAPYLFTSIGANTTPYSELGVGQAESAASEVVRAVFSNAEARHALLQCEPSAPGDACVQSFLDRFGRRAYRRPMTPTERERWLWVATDLAEGDPWLGLESAVAGMLQSPHVLYRVEVGIQPDGSDSTGDERRLSGYEMAARLSYLLWNTTPDDALLDAAAAGQLDHTEGLEGHARRMLNDPRARATIQAFFVQYLDLKRLEHAAPDPELFPGFTESLRDAMRTEVELIVDDVVYRRDADVRTLFSTRRTFVNPELAAHYGLPVPDVSPITFVPMDLDPNGPRAGVLSLGAFLTMNAHPIETSPTLRGKFVMERVLCALVPPPPDDVDLDLGIDEGPEPRTLRERLEAHRDDPACSGCHQQIDPPGYLFEYFDSVGRWRATESGQPVDARGEILGQPLDGTKDLGSVLATEERVAQCMTRQLFRHAHGRLDTADDAVTLDQLEQAFAEGDHSFKELLVALVTHPSFRSVTAPVEAP